MPTQLIDSIDRVVNTIFNMRPHCNTEEVTSNLTPLVPFPSRMAVQVIRTDEDQSNGQFATVVRHLFTEDMAASGVDYDQEHHFMLHETSQFLDDRVARYGVRSSGLPMVYGLLSVDGHGEDGKDDAATWFRGIVGTGKQKANGCYDTQFVSFPCRSTVGGRLLLAQEWSCEKRNSVRARSSGS